MVSMLLYLSLGESVMKFTAALTDLHQHLKEVGQSPLFLQQDVFGFSFLPLLLHRAVHGQALQRLNVGNDLH